MVTARDEITDLMRVVGGWCAETAGTPPSPEFTAYCRVYAELANRKTRITRGEYTDFDGVHQTHEYIKGVSDDTTFVNAYMATKMGR